MNLKKEVRSIVKKYNLIGEKDNIIVGVSGGSDSMALLYVLLEIQDELDFNIYIVHVNHGVRGKEAKEDQLFVRRKAEELNLPYYTKDVDMVQHGKDTGVSAEEAGRELRYGFFREVLNKVGKGKIAIAQNMNDQAETLLMRFLRGTGIDGLKGMEYIVGDIIRPVLGISRKGIERYIKKNNIPTVLDKTNLMPIYTRNKVRLELIPYIEKNFNPNIVKTLWRTSDISALDSKFLEKYSKDRYTNIVKKEEENYIVLDGEKFLKEDRSIQQRIIREGILRVNKSLQGISEIQVSSVLDMFSTNETGKEYHLSNDIIAKTSYNDFIIGKNDKNDEKKYEYGLDMEKPTTIRDLGYTFYLKKIDKEELSMDTKNNNVEYFDFDKVRGKLGVRNRRNGDRIIPFGMKGTKKLKDYFMDEKIPRELRNNIPLIFDDKNILWVVGYRTNELYRVTKNTKTILEIEFKSNIGNREDKNGGYSKGNINQ